MAFCVNCGTQLPDGAVFCPGCGTKREIQPAQIPAAEPIATVEPPVAVPFEEAQILAEQPSFGETEVLGAQEPAPVYEEAPAFVAEKPQPPVYQPPVYQPPVQEPVYQQPTYQPPVYSYQQPVPEAQPVVSAGAKVKGFIGMGLGIMAFVMGIITLLLGLGSLGDSSAAVGAIIYALMSIGFGIPAKILSGKAISEGFVGTPTKLGNIFGLLGIIFGGVAFFFGLIGSAM